MTEPNCIFCQPDNPQLHTVVARSRFAYATLDAYPLSDGHVVIVPFRHVGSAFDLTENELRDMWQLSATSRRTPVDGYTIGINDGPAAGQTIPHVHLHVIPRHMGDVPNPRGGIRRIFPDDTYSAGQL